MLLDQVRARLWKPIRNFLISIAVFAVASCGGSVQGTRSNLPAVFLGASIIQFWQSYVDFPSHDWIDKGVSGQKCGEVLARVQTDVVALNPATLHLICGTNDILLGPTDPATTEANIMEIVALARAAHIRVILATIPPVRAGLSMKFPTDTPQQIIAFNQWIRSYAQDEGIPLADYYSALVGPDGQYVAAYTSDGVHPSAQGYAVMTSIILQFF